VLHFKAHDARSQPHQSVSTAQQDLTQLREVCTPLSWCAVRTEPHPCTLHCLRQYANNTASILWAWSTINKIFVGQNAPLVRARAPALAARSASARVPRRPRPPAPVAAAEAPAPVWPRRLQEAGWGVDSMTRSAELLKYTWPGWTKELETTYIK
jgi:hypothetical protein